MTNSFPSFLLPITLALLVGGSLLTGCRADAAIATSAPASPPPRILLLEANNMGWADLNCYGSFLVESPNLDELASDGVQFLQAYTGDHEPFPLAELIANGYAARELSGEQSDVTTTDEVLRQLEQLRDQRWAIRVSFGGPALPATARPDLVEYYQDLIDSTHWRPYPTVNYAAKVAEVDEQAGRIVDWLRRHDQLDSTLIVFTSSGGGPGPNGPLRGATGSLHEGGIRIPFIVHYPVATTETRSQDTPVTNDDVRTTILDLLRVPGRTGGRDLLPLLEGEKFPNRYLFWARSDSAAVRYGPYKMILDRATGAATYYNLTQFPDEGGGSKEGPRLGLRAALDEYLSGHD